MQKELMLSTSMAAKAMIKSNLPVIRSTVVGGAGADSIEHDYNTAGGEAVNFLVVQDDTLKITGSHNAANTLSGEAGEDTIVDTVGGSVLDGGADDDSITTGAGDDVVYGRAGWHHCPERYRYQTGWWRWCWHYQVTSAFNINDTIKGELGTDVIDNAIAAATLSTVISPTFFYWDPCWL